MRRLSLPTRAFLLDTSVVLAYLNASEAASPAATVVIDDFVRTGRNRATIRVVSVAETLVRPVAAGAAARPGEPEDAPCAHHRHGVERRDLDRSRERREVGGQPVGKSERQRQIQMRCRPLLAGVEACKINEFDVLAGTRL